MNVFHKMKVEVNGESSTVAALFQLAFEVQGKLSDMYKTLAEALIGAAVDPALLTQKGVNDTADSDGNKEDKYYKGISLEALAYYAKQKPEDNAVAVMNMNADNRTPAQAKVAKLVGDSASKMRGGVRLAMMELIEGKKAAARGTKTIRIPEHIIADSLKKEISKLQELSAKNRRVACDHTGAIADMVAAYKKLSATVKS